MSSTAFSRSNFGAPLKPAPRLYFPSVHSPGRVGRSFRPRRRTAAESRCRHKIARTNLEALVGLVALLGSTIHQPAELVLSSLVLLPGRSPRCFSVWRPIAAESRRCCRPSTAAGTEAQSFRCASAARAQ